MEFLYWLALVFGGGLFALSLFGEWFGAHGHADPTGGHVDIHHGDFHWSKLFSLRNLTYFLFAFGATGVLASTVAGDLVSAVAATGTGVVAWVLSSTLFGYLKKSESGERPTDRTLVGKVGQVTLPMVSGGTGKVMVTRSGQTQELLAKPMASEEGPVETWHSVVIVEVRDGIAYVAPYSEETTQS
jgi:hypothetical protein